MLYPQTNSYRQSKDLSGFWDFKLDPSDSGFKKGWHEGFDQGRIIGVPGSWNDQFQDTRDYLGPAWYQTKFDLPWGFEDQKIFLRFDSVNYMTHVWLNGVKLGEHEGGHLPFIFAANHLLKPTGNLLVMRVEGMLAPDRVPPGNIPFDRRDAFFATFYPNASFDFFPYCGIHRPVHLFSVPQDSITDLTVLTDIKGKTGKVEIRIDAKTSPATQVKVSLKGFGKEIKAERTMGGDSNKIILTVPNAKLWDTDNPNLYDLTVELANHAGSFDRVNLAVGIRTIKVTKTQVLLNGKPVDMKGFGRHEDFPITGRHMPLPVIVKDYQLMKWVGADSFRTSHYPYSDEMMNMADRLGFLIVDEIPAVGLFFHKSGLKKRLELCRQYFREVIARDKNHPSVIMWSMADEPHSHRPGVKKFFKNLVDLIHELDAARRPITVAGDIGIGDDSNYYCDVICINRYWGWYTHPGDLDKAMKVFSADLDSLYKHFKRPIFVTEFGADAIPGHHAEPAEMFSEEFESEMIKRYIEVIKTKKFVVGAHIWVLCDFKTAQATHRAGALNWKGVFTRDRRPKLAAHTLRKLWKTGGK